MRKIRTPIVIVGMIVAFILGSMSTVTFVSAAPNGGWQQAVEDLQIQIDDIISGVTSIAMDWDNVQNKPAGFADDVDDVGLTSVDWDTDIVNIPAGFDDDVDDVGLTTISHEIVSLNAGFPASTTTTQTLDCPAGKIVTGGGFSGVDDDLKSLILDSYPSSITSWSVTVKNTNAQQDRIFIYAICMDDNRPPP